MISLLDSIAIFLDRTGFSFIAFLVVVVFGTISVKCILKIVKYSLLQSSLDKLLVKFVMTIVRIVLYVALMLYALKVLGIPLSGAVTALSAITLAIGLAIQDIIAGVASGMMLVSIHPFKVGDYIEVGDFGGSVKEVNLFHTVLTTPDNKQMMIPNKSIFASEIVNYSHNDTRRLDLYFTADLRADREKVKQVIMDTAKANPMVFTDPAPIVRPTEKLANEMKFQCRVWVTTDNYWTLNFELYEQVLDALEKAGIEIPLPQISVSYRDNKEVK